MLPVILWNPKFGCTSDAVAEEGSIEKQHRWLVEVGFSAGYPQLDARQ